MLQYVFVSNYLLKYGKNIDRFLYFVLPPQTPAVTKGLIICKKELGREPTILTINCMGGVECEING